MPRTLRRALGIATASTLLVTLGASKGSQSQKNDEPKEIWISDVLNDDRLVYKDYVLEKRIRKVACDSPTAERSCSIDVSFAVLKRKRRLLARFDDNIYFGMGNDTRFGLISIMGGTGRQFVISQDIPRSGTQWIVSLSPKPKVIFDGPRWMVGREGDDMRVIDLDHNGTYEIVVPTFIFYGFASLSPAATPLPSIVFKYSRRSKRFLPANPHFAKYVLDGIQDRKAKIHHIGSPPDDMNHAGEVLGVVLDYIFAGQRQQAWTFYDQAYKLPDKTEMKRRVRAELRRSPVYNFIYRRRARTSKN